VNDMERSMSFYPDGLTISVSEETENE